ncbi:IS1634 family transposase [Marinobacter excellens]|uniref:Mobile element protein n=1 Tax=Marinobacter excellens LAMA 842 TaxID=1306954 RepID=A0A137S324_9GAMM|nr:IS1634 family transposase [Marinobacter excellens]KXO06845.1 Mobile element protein [Marinobacter excellens LAMA 842]
MARKPAPFNLTVNDQLELESWLRTSTLSQNLVQRARIVLALNNGESPKTVAERLETSTPTVFKWRNRYIEQGLSGLQDAPRPGQPRKLDRKKVKSILDDTVKKLPKESTHWSVRLMAEHAGVSRWQVHQIWKAADLKPHRLKTFKISNDPDFAEKVFDVVGLYLNPPDNALVLSVDEKTQIQALDRTQLEFILAVPGRRYRGRKLSDAGVTARFYKAVTDAHLGHILKVDLTAETFNYVLDQRALDRARMMDGKLLLVTNMADHDPLEIVERYRALADIERGFRVLKSDIEIAPVYHRLPDRIRAHALICFLALVLYRVLRMRLKASNHPLSPTRALEIARKIQFHQVLLHRRETASGLTKLKPEQRDLFEAIGLPAPAASRL